MINYHSSVRFSSLWWIFMTMMNLLYNHNFSWLRWKSIQIMFHHIIKFSSNWSILMLKNYSNTKLRTSSHWWFPIIGSFSKLFTIVLFGHRRNFPPDHFLFMIVINFDIDISRFENHSDLITTSILAELGPAQPQLVFYFLPFQDCTE